MIDLLAQIRDWQTVGERVALATVIRVEGSAPRPVGAKMIVSSGGRISGSVSGGCVESAVMEEGAGVLATGEPRLLEFGVTDDQAWEVGLSCGGEIEVFVEVLDPRDRSRISGMRREIYDELRSSLDAGQAEQAPGVGSHQDGCHVDHELVDESLPRAVALLREGVTTLEI